MTTAKERIELLELYLEHNEIPYRRSEYRGGIIGIDIPDSYFQLESKGSIGATLHYYPDNDGWHIFSDFKVDSDNQSLRRKLLYQINHANNKYFYNKFYIQEDLTEMSGMTSFSKVYNSLPYIESSQYKPSGLMIFVEEVVKSTYDLKVTVDEMLERIEKGWEEIDDMGLYIIQ